MIDIVSCTYSAGSEGATPTKRRRRKRSRSRNRRDKKEAKAPEGVIEAWITQRPKIEELIIRNILRGIIHRCVCVCVRVCVCVLEELNNRNISNRTASSDFVLQARTMWILKI